MFKFFFNAFRRAKGERVTAEYVVIDENKLTEADKKHLIESDQGLVMASEEMLEDYQEVTRLCKTYIADPKVFALCREIEKRIRDILLFRLTFQGRDRWLYEDRPLPLRNDEKGDEEEP